MGASLGFNSSFGRFLPQFGIFPRSCADDLSISLGCFAAKIENQGASARSLAADRPMPEPPPVTTITLPLNRAI